MKALIMAIMLIPSIALADYGEAMRNLFAGNVLEAKRELLSLAEQGDGLAQYQVGNMYLTGGMPGIQRDIKQAIVWFSKSANQGIEGAEFELAEMYFKGVGLPKDNERAIFWYQKVAAQGKAHDGIANSRLQYLRSLPSSMPIKVNNAPDKTTAESEMVRPLVAIEGETASVPMPSGILMLGWKTILLPDGSLLGIGNADTGRHSLAFLYDVKSSKWRSGGNIPDGIVGLGSSAKLLPTGTVLTLGSDANYNSVALKYDPAANQWSSAGRLPSKFIGDGKNVLVLSTGNVLVLGDAEHTVGWLYNYRANSWMVTQGLPEKISKVLYAKEIKNGRVLVVAEDDSKYRNWVGLLYEISSNSWKPTGKFPAIMGGNNIEATTLSDGSCLVIGSQASPEFRDVALLYNPQNNLWISAGALPKEAYSIKAIESLQDGSVFTIFGGLLESSGLTGLLYSPTKNEWSYSAPPPAGLVGIRAMRKLSNGKLWAIGYQMNVLLSKEMVYSPESNSWAVRDLPNGIVHISASVGERDAVLMFIGPNNGYRSTVDEVILHVP